MNNEDLLRPTLSEFRKVPALYTSTGFFLSSFFGGPAGATIYGVANSHRLGRLAQDLPVILGVCAAAFFVPIALDDEGLMRPFAQFLDVSLQRAWEIALRALALGCFGAIYLMHRKFFRAARVAAVKPLPSWGVGITAVVVGIIASRAFIYWVLKHH